MTQLFYQDTHITSFEALVTDCIPQENGRYGIILSQTAFFPEEGGQGADSGTLGGLKVLDVQIRDSIIYHIVGAALKPGTTVTGHVDWNQRFDYMQQHSGEHILSGLIHARFGYQNVGFHLGKEEVTLDFNGSISKEELQQIELEANRIIWKNLPVLVSFPPQQVLQELQYRSKLELTDNVRIVEIPGVDICACCAPHVDSTGQIGLLKVTDLQSHRGGVRIHILCGERAYHYVSQHQESAANISQLLSVKQEKITDGVLLLKEEVFKLRQRNHELQAQILNLQTTLLPSPEEKEHILLFTGELDNIAIRNTVNSLCEKYSGYCCLFSKNTENNYRFIIGSASLDCRTIASLLQEKLNAKGGGTAPMVQGSVSADKEAICHVLEPFI